MSVNSILGSAVSGLSTSQTAMRTTSANIANVNTPGYARARTELTPLASAGVEASAVRRVADAFLQRASMQAAADAAGAERAFAMLDRLQAQFGGLDDPGSLFGRLNATAEPFALLASNPASSANRVSAVSAVEATLEEIARLSAETRGLRAEADQRIAAGVERANELLRDISDMNGEIQRALLGGGDATGVENDQAQMLDELATLMDVRVQQRSGGGVDVRTGDGLMLVGQTAGVLSYSATGAGDPGVQYGQITLRHGSGVAVALDPHLKSGEIAAMIKVRDVELPAVAAELGELAAGYADALNAAHNEAAAVPAPNRLEGRNTGLVAGDALGFSGAASLGVTAADGTLAHRIDIDFDAGALSVDGGAATAFGATMGGLATALNAALAGLGGSASFSGGRLTLNAGAGEGLAVQQSAASPSDRAGRGFSHFFGLNDLVSSDRPGFFETGLTGAEAHGFTPGQTLSFSVSGASGSAQQISVAVGGATINDVLSQLNNPVSGLGRYATFALDSNGALSMTPTSGDVSVALTGDTTRRGTTGVSFSQLFGLGAQARAGRAEIYSVRTDIAADGQKLALAAPQIAGAALGDFVLGTGDGRGALGLQSALEGPRGFSAAGAIAAGTMSVTDFAARIAGDVGGRAARAERARQSAETLQAAANEQRSSVEGVNLDEELANMTLYQQSYNASARLLQAAKEMTDVLLSLV